MVRTGRLRTSDRRTRLLGRGAKQRGEQVTELFTVLFTARDGGVPVGSAADCGPFPTCYRSHKLLGRSRGHGRDLERRQFSPVKTEVISVTLTPSLPWSPTGDQDRASRASAFRAIVQLRRPRHFDSPPTQHHPYPSRSSRQSSRMRRDEPVSIR